MARVIKVGENNVEYTPEKTIKDKDGNDVVVYDEDAKESWGADIAQAKAEAQKELDRLNALSASKLKTEVTSKYQDFVDKAALIEAELNK